MVGPILEILDPICWDFCTRCSCVDSSEAISFSTIFDLEMDLARCFALYYSKFNEVVSRFDFISAGGGAARRDHLPRRSKLPDLMFPRRLYVFV